MFTDARLDVIRKFQGDRSQNEYARFLAVDPSTLSLVLAGKRNPNLVLINLMGRIPEAADDIAAALAAPDAEKVEQPA